MDQLQNQPVEISNRLNEGEWTQESVDQLLEKYRRDFADMGAQPEEVTAEAVPTADGGVDVKAVWNRQGARSFEDFGSPASSNHANAGALGEAIPEGATTEGSRGLGAVYGEADRSPESL